MPIKSPFNFKKWIDDHKDSLKPPINACLVFEESSFIIMVIGGPNARTDYHVNQTDEFFYQLVGDMLLKIVDDGEFRDIHIKEGEVFLLPGNTPHSPQRFANTVGLVIEQKRTGTENDALRWYCENPKCQALVYEKVFHCPSIDLGPVMAPIMKEYAASTELRTCKKCNHVNIDPISTKSNAN